MTRINVGIRPSLLCREHLLAEHREMKRIPNKVSKGKFTLNGIPPEFKLGTGHEKFFYNKLNYLKRRYEAVYAECIKRELDVTYYGGAWDNVPNELMGGYRPRYEDAEILVDRINERLKIMIERYEKKGDKDNALRLKDSILFIKSKEHTERKYFNI